jgi:signal transduction histidine kinase
LALMIILMVGAGRKHGGEAGGGETGRGGSGSGEVRKVFFMAIDKPWLDIGLCALVGYEAAICYATYESFLATFWHDYTRWIYALCAALSVLFTLPLLWWLTSFAKRCKAGKWWRYTLIYSFIRWIFDSARRMAKSLWSGFPLTLRVVVLGLILFTVTAVCISIYPSTNALLLCVVFAALAVFGLLRFTQKLYLVQEGAKAASGGQYGEPIAVTGGELGSIAASINSISDGINAAVAERLKSERLRTELITNISHDIRTPLTSLITYTDLLKSEGLQSERAPDYLDILIQKSARLKTLTDDLFEASKAASGNIDVQIGTLDLADLVRQVLGELDERVRASGLDFRLNLSEHAQVNADGRLLWRVIENLMSNVFKYALSGSRVYIDLEPEDEWYRLDIKNISERPLNVEPSELIERFKRGDEARSSDGSGLGLSIAQSFVQSQGGRFKLSIDGDLFKVSLYLPGSAFAQ